MEAQSRIRLLLSAVVALTLAATAFGYWVNWPWLSVEYSRQEPPYRELIWTADGVAFLWFAWFAFRYCILGTPLPTVSKRDAEFFSALLTMISAVVISIGMTVAIAVAEESAVLRAVAVPGAIVGGRTSYNGELGYLACRFQGMDGRWYDGKMQINLDREIPPAGAKAVRDKQFPIPVQIAYDPQWPPRCWLGRARQWEDNRLWLMLVCCLIFQAILVPAGLGIAMRPAGIAKARLYEILPIWGGLLPLWLSGLGKFLIGEF